jgi:hypothetical protein
LADVKAELHGVLAFRPAEVVGELETLLAGIEARIRAAHAKIADTADGQTDLAERRYEI